MSDVVTRLNAALDGRYAIEREIGQGGMATVYLAKDLKHNRNVALKVLKPELAAVVGADRFLAEIETTANLQHPHILPLFDSGQADSFLYYAMPYIEGETLREKLDREHQLPVDEAVQIATNVAEALDYAHRQGVIHRDIKPANILLQEGKPVISDFGIALAVGTAGQGRLTETGLSVGTPHYMSPEQATGDQTTGPATDTYALGCVLYEMLVGEPPYTGSTAQAILSKIIAGRPASVTKQRASVPANVDAGVRKALEKLPADRFASVQGFVRALGDEHFRHGEVVGEVVGANAGPWNRLTVAMTALAVVSTLIAAALGWAVLQPDAPRRVTRVSVRLPEEQSLFIRGDLDLSDDGSVLVYRGGRDEGQAMLWARPWDALEATPIRGTEGASHPAISPDGREVAFNDRGEAIRVVPLEGGAPRTLIDGASQVPAWSPDGDWIFYRGSTGGVHRQPATGGSEEILTAPNYAAGEIAHAHVNVLPGGQKFVYHVVGSRSFVGAADLETGDTKILTPGSYPRYSAATGHLLYLDETATLVAAPFDVEQLELGTPRPVADRLTMISNGMGFFDVSETGRLVYLTGGDFQAGMAPVWVDREGEVRMVDTTWSVDGDPSNSSLSLSPDRTRLAISLPGPGGGYDLWVKQFGAGPPSRLTFEGQVNRRPTWSADSRSLTFVSSRSGQDGLWRKRVDGSGAAEPVLDPGQAVHEGFFSPDGSWLVFTEEPVIADTDIYITRPTLDSAAVPFVATEADERSPALSPDGRWLAYMSNGSGRHEVYVRSFPEGSGFWAVSTDGGSEPVWAPSGQELFYRSPANELISVQITGDPTFATGRQTVLFSMRDYLKSEGHPQYDVRSDGQEFIMFRLREDRGASTELILVENWFEELKERMGGN